MTIVTQKRRRILGDVRAGRTVPSDLGSIIRDVWEAIPERLPAVRLDAFVLMPNHVHGIVYLDSPDANAESVLVGAGLALPNCPASLPDVVRTFKSISTIEVNRHLRRTGQPLWQRNYYERIIRDEDEWNRIRQYIIENPRYWEHDPENPDAKTDKQPSMKMDFE